LKINKINICQGKTLPSLFQVVAQIRNHQAVGLIVYICQGVFVRLDQPEDSAALLLST